jgi:hypothetical protein
VDAAPDRFNSYKSGIANGRTANGCPELSTRVYPKGLHNRVGYPLDRRAEQRFHVPEWIQGVGAPVRNGVYRARLFSCCLSNFAPFDRDAEDVFQRSLRMKPKPSVAPNPFNLVSATLPTGRWRD